MPPIVDCTSLNVENIWKSLAWNCRWQILIGMYRGVSEMKEENAYKLHVSTTAALKLRLTYSFTQVLGLLIDKSLQKWCFGATSYLMPNARLGEIISRYYPRGCATGGDWCVETAAMFRIPSSTKIALQWKQLPFRVHPGSLLKSLHICSANPSPMEKKALIDCTVMLHILLFLAVISPSQPPKGMGTASRFPERHSLFTGWNKLDGFDLTCTSIKRPQVHPWRCQLARWNTSYTACDVLMWWQPRTRGQRQSSQEGLPFNCSKAIVLIQLHWSHVV